MPRYIDADLLLNEIEIDYSGYIFSENCSPLEFINIIEKQPTADVKEVAHGEWKIEKKSKFNYDKCSACGFNKPSFLEFREYGFCPHCGADMRDIK